MCIPSESRKGGRYSGVFGEFSSTPALGEGLTAYANHYFDPMAGNFRR